MCSSDLVLINDEGAVKDIPIVYGERQVGGTRVFTSTNGYMVPIITALIGVLALGENIGLVAFFSYALVLIGLLLSRN